VVTSLFFDLMISQFLFTLATATVATTAGAIHSQSQSQSHARGCPITNTTNIVYSIAEGVGPASRIWVQDLLWWWQQQGDARLDYLALSGRDLQNCDLASFPNLKVYINPGGDAYSQLSDMGVEGRDHVISFVERGQQEGGESSAYVGFCAGGYIAAHDYLWETMYEGPGYYNFEETPPLSIFPFTLEGSIVDINDDQFGDQYGSKFRLVNVSNGQKMLYYGGSTFGYSGTGDPTNPSSELYDPEVEVLVYYTDFYGFQAHNIPAAWRYRNVVMTSVHPEADNCTYAQDSDCPPSGSIPTENILQNRAWLGAYINEAAKTNFRIPEVPVAPVFDTTAPHTETPAASCYSRSSEVAASGTLLFCDGFDSEAGQVAFGLSPQFQRNQSDYNRAWPWNTSQISSWNGGAQYASAQEGNGYAVAVPKASVSHVSTITTKSFSVEQCTSGEALLSLYVQGKTLSGGAFSIKYRQLNQAEVNTDPFSPFWKTLYSAALSPAVEAWELLTIPFPIGGNGGYVRLEFSCAAGAAVDNYCAIDTLSVTC
jgi:glutamine amidotransferase-like uncharacterized protein